MKYTVTSANSNNNNKLSAKQLVAFATGFTFEELRTMTVEAKGVKFTDVDLVLFVTSLAIAQADKDIKKEKGAAKLELQLLRNRLAAAFARVAQYI